MLDALDTYVPIVLIAGDGHHAWINTTALLTLHLPLREEGRYAEALRLARAALTTAPAPLWLSHLPADQVRGLAAELRGADGPVPVRARVGTRLWLGAAAGRRTTATVLDVDRVRRGERAGYRGRVVPGNGWVVVVAGGTSHGVGLEAPTSASSWRQRATALATCSSSPGTLPISIARPTPALVRASAHRSARPSVEPGWSHPTSRVTSCPGVSPGSPF